jgi:hypothetical protein
MNTTRPSFISERVRVNPPLSANALRYQYLNLQNAEPNFGVPTLTASNAFDTFVLATNSIGERFILKTVLWDSTYTTLKANSATWLTVETADSRYLRLTGGTIEGDLLVKGGVFATGGLSAVSAQYFITTITSITSLSVQSLGYEPALFVGAGGGNFYIASFKDMDNNVEVLRIMDATGGKGKVGINTIAPLTELTVNGSISTNSVFYAGNFTSDQFSSTYVSTRTTSANWDTVYSTVRSLSNSWEESAEIIPTVTNYLSTNNVLIKNLTVTTGLSVNGGLSADRIFGTFQNNIIDAFVGDGITTTFNLTQTVASVNNILVYVGGIYQDKVTYSIASGPSRIIFTQPPPAPDIALEPNIEIVFLHANPMQIGTVADASITTQKIADRAVTSRKLDSNLTVFGSLSVVGTLSAANYVLTNSFIPYQTFDVAPGQTTFSLLCAVASLNDISVYISGVYQNKSTLNLPDEYTLSLTQTPPVGLNIVEVIYNRPFPAVSMYPSQNSVLTSSIANNAVTTDKIASNAVNTRNISAGAITGDKIVTGATINTPVLANASGTLTGPTITNLTGTGTTTLSVLSVINTSSDITVYVGNSIPGSTLSKMGINTNNPNNELTVVGNISASGNIVSTSLLETIVTNTFIFS